MAKRLALLALFTASAHAWISRAPLARCVGSGTTSVLLRRLAAVPPPLADGPLKLPDDDLLGSSDDVERTSFMALMKNKHAGASLASDKKDGHHLSIGQLLSEYGLIALAFHFTVWSISLATVYAALSAGVQLPEMPEFLTGLLRKSGEGAEAAEYATASIGVAAGAGAGGKAAAMARVAATVGLVEVVGPLRLALTVAVTPPLSGYVRQFSAVRDAEAQMLRFLGRVKAKLLPGAAPPQ